VAPDWRDSIELVSRYSLQGSYSATDISLAVIHKRAKRPSPAKRSELVNNCAAD
jgi:hypothetical protein